MTLAVQTDSNFLIESVFENYKTYEHIFTDRHPTVDKAIGTSTFNGRQQEFEVSQLLEQDLKNKINEAFDKSNMMLEFDSIDVAWLVEYRQGGYQTLHNHLRDGADNYNKQLSETGQGIGSVIVCYDTMRNSTDGADEEGCFYGLMDNSYISRSSTAGTIWIMDCQFWHGVYPVPRTRRVLVFDFFYKKTDS